MTEPATLAAFMGRYAKEHHAGGFAMPTKADIASHPEQFHIVGTYPDIRAAARITTLKTGSTRQDFTGTKYQLEPGTTIATHVATSDHCRNADLVRLLDPCDAVYAYADDPKITEWAERRGWQRGPTRISAASEIITCWNHVPWPLPPADRLTTAEVALRSPAPIGLMTAEALKITVWTDDFPYYSDGTWSSISLRGYDPDPRWGIKPAEMSKEWKASHPGDLGRKCGWTDLAQLMPATVSWLKAQPWQHGLERVRLLRMAAAGESGGHLARHSDITDRGMGTRDGQIARFHLPIITAPGAEMQWWELDGSGHTAHLEAGRLYYLDARKPHAVTNRSGIDRIHLVADVIADDKVRWAIGTARPLA